MEYLLDELVPRPRQHPASDGTAPPAFTAVLAGLQQWLRTEGFPFVIVGSLACAAWTGQDSLARLSRPGGFGRTRRCPDVDVLVPRTAVAAVARYSRTARSGPLPVAVDVSGCGVFHRPFVHLVDEVLATAPPGAASSIRYFVMPAAKATVAKMNRTRASAGAR